MKTSTELYDEYQEASERERQARAMGGGSLLSSDTMRSHLYHLEVAVIKEQNLKESEETWSIHGRVPFGSSSWGNSFKSPAELLKEATEWAMTPAYQPFFHYNRRSENVNHEGWRKPTFKKRIIPLSEVKVTIYPLAEEKLRAEGIDLMGELKKVFASQRKATDKERKAFERIRWLFERIEDLERQDKKQRTYYSYRHDVQDDTPKLQHPKGYVDKEIKKLSKELNQLLKKHLSWVDKEDW